MQNIKFFIRFYFASGMVHPVQCQKDFPYFLFGGGLPLGSDFIQMGNQGKKKANSSFVLPTIKTLRLFKVFPIALQLGKACLRVHKSLQSRKPSSCVRMCRPEVGTWQITIAQVTCVSKLSHLPALICARGKSPVWPVGTVQDYQQLSFLPQHVSLQLE